MPPELFGPYRLEGLLGRGGMGEVYRAYDTVRNRSVAVKRLLPAYVSDELYRARFFRECHSAAQLNEAHVIPIHDFGEIEGRLFLDMRLVEGTDLAGILADGPLPADRAVDVVGQVAAALDAAHASGLVHRDVKPSNVLICDGTSTSHCYLVDFGVAGTAGAGTTGSLTRTGMIAGTLDYIAPERLEHHQVDARADVYSLACLLYESLTAQPPFPCADIAALCFAHVFRQPPRPSEAVPSVPAALDDVVARGMAKDPEQRYASAGDLARAARDAVRVAADGTPERRRSMSGTAIPLPRSPDPVEQPRQSVRPVDRAPVRSADRPGSEHPRRVDAEDPVGGPRPRPRRSQRLLWSVLVVTVLAAAAAAVGVLAGGRWNAQAATPVRAEPAGAPGEDPFTHDGTVKAPTPGSASAAPETGQPAVVSGSTTVSGGTPGLYGGTGSNTCDPSGMATFLEEQPDRGRAWARAEGIPVSTIRSFLGALTGVVLRTDTAVTNHGYAHGRATTFQAVLQAGTAVLVDDHGVPRARCACGNPLGPPTVWSAPRYAGAPWTGFAPSNVTVIQQSETEIPVFVIVETGSNKVQTRPAGTTGSADAPADPIQEEAAKSTFTLPSVAGETTSAGEDPTTTPGSSTGSRGPDPGPGTTDPGTTDSSTTAPGTTDSGTPAPGTTDPGTTDSGTTDSGTTDSGTTDAGSTAPGTTDPGTTDPGTTDPGTTDPGATDPGATDSGTAGSGDSSGSPLPGD